MATNHSHTKRGPGRRHQQGGARAVNLGPIRGMVFVVRKPRKRLQYAHGPGSIGAHDAGTRERLGAAAGAWR